MRTFTCACGNTLHFENTHCVVCGRQVGFDTGTRTMVALDPAGDNVWQISGTGERRRICANGTEYGVCNWLIPESSANARCDSCRLNQIIPNLGESDHLVLWGRLEAAKRRLLYTLLQLNLPFETDPRQAGALAFRFLAEAGPRAEVPGANDRSEPVYTGHHHGVITINLKEADTGTRESIREAMNEPYRSLLGHFRHESGHYFWDRLIRDTSRQDEFRALFGDERTPYQEALASYYARPAPDPWPGLYVSAYASAHPWEDWAETWAHYLHMIDGLDTAFAQGLELGEISFGPLYTGPDGSAALPWEEGFVSFDELVRRWQALTVTLNAMNRSLGLSDVYPFALSEAVIDKLEFVHRVVHDL
ncbi:MAG: putative zinc-binding peptidase [Pseudomonadota bacterium]